jgi:hypothetical protein
MHSLSRSPQPTCVFLSSLPSHHEINFSLWPQLLIPLFPSLPTIFTEMTIKLSTRTTRLRSATTASTWALKSPSTLCLSMRCWNLLSNPSLYTSRTFNLLKWDLPPLFPSTESRTMEHSHLASTRTTRFAISGHSLPLPLFPTRYLDHQRRPRAAH